MNNGSKKTRINITVDPTVIEEVRNAAYFTPGESISAIAERGMKKEVERLKQERGEDFPPRPLELR